MKNFIQRAGISILILLLGMISQFQTFGQQIKGTDDLNPPTDLTAEVIDNNDVSLFWLQPYNADSTYLHWDDGENYTSWGNFLNAVEMDYAAKWDPEHIDAYDGYLITEMRFYVVTPQPDIILKIWTGPDTTEIYSQELSDWNVNDWTTVALDSAITIDASEEMWAVLTIDMPTTGASMGCDDGPAIDGNGNLYRLNGVWYYASLNWNIQLKIETAPTKATNSLLGYNVYRNDDQINTETLMGTSYLDEDLLNGTYDYYVTAVYDDGESEATETVEVIIDQPGILPADSLALVDLYYNCNGVNWPQQDLWLEGPVNEWSGVTTEGTRVTKLHLQSNGLVGDIPASIGDLTALESLHLESNSINSIPDEISALTELKELWLGWNPISDVPESIGYLTNLEQLHLGSMETPLETLPSTFGNLVNLNWLALGGSGLNSLPSTFGNLTSLENCFIWGNNLTELPENFGDLESLVWLSAEDNQLTSLPAGFGDLSNLETLYLDNNQLTELPESFGNLESLFMFKCQYNQLTSLSENFGDLDNLSYLHAYGNQLPSLPESFGSLESLDTCYLFNNQLTALPESMGNLSDLQLMDLSQNFLSVLPESMGSLATIEELYLGENELKELPDDFDGMPALIMLTVNTNHLSTLPESICNLPTLKYFYAGGNQLTEIPENIGNLDSLVYLSMNVNQITEIPESIGNLTNLELLNLSLNEINEIPEIIGDMESLIAIGIGGNNLTELPESMFGNQYDYLHVMENELQFGSLEPMMGNVSQEFLYYDQAKIGIDTIIDVPYDSEISYSIDVSGADNIYKWYKDGSLMSDQVSNHLLIENPDNGDVGVYVLKVTNTSIPDLELVSHNFIVSDLTNIEDKAEHNFKIYPNPAAGHVLNIALNNQAEVKRIVIMNVNGQVLSSEVNITKNVALDISNLKKGMYFVKVEFYNNYSKTEKLIVR